MNLKHETIRMNTIAYREDVFYGYIREGKDTFYIQQLSPDYCKITSVVDACFMYSFDFSYFDTYKEDLENYGPEFKSKYAAYKENNKLRWQQIDQKKQFCLKVTDSIYPSPILPFAGVLEYIYRILDYADLQQAREELENYKNDVVEAIESDKYDAIILNFLQNYLFEILDVFLGPLGE